MNDNYWLGMLVNFLIIIGGLAGILWYANAHNAFTFQELSQAMDKDIDRLKDPAVALTSLILVQPLIFFISRRLSKVKLFGNNNEDNS